jgi:hypothetical protein
MGGKREKKRGETGHLFSRRCSSSYTKCAKNTQFSLSTNDEKEYETPQKASSFKLLKLNCC